jgi:phosphatidylinositol 3-kinase
MKGDAYARSIYENILNQEKFLKSLNEVVRTIKREGGLRDAKVVKLRSLLLETATKSSSNFSNLIDFESSIPLILDPTKKIHGISVEKASIFKSSLMPCKFVFKSENGSEYSTIYKIGDDLRQDQLVLQMIALMDKVSDSLI